MKKRYTIIAEIAGGHMGMLDRCLDLVNAAADADADAVKFQFYKAAELCPKGHKDHDLFKTLEFEFSDWEKIFQKARERKLSIHADVFGMESFREASALNVDGFKLHAADMDNTVLGEAVASTGKPIFLGVGGHKRIEIYRAIKKLRSISSSSPIILMPGHQLFPTPVSEHSLDEIHWLSNAYRDLGVLVGCADHIDGDDPMAVGFPIAAIGAGAVVIEKHLTIDRRQRWEDYESAIEPDQFHKLAKLVHAFSDTTANFPQWTVGRQTYREKSVKVYMADQNLKKEELVSSAKLKFLRPNVFSNPLPVDYFDQRAMAGDVRAGEVLRGTDVQQRVGMLINCRTASKRLPNKALSKICGKETIALLIERMKYCACGSRIVLCTTEHPEDDALVAIAEREKIGVFRGPDENVALRLLMASRANRFDHIVRVTGDDLLRDVSLIDLAVASHLQAHADYTFMTGVVYSCDSEIISTRALETIVDRASCPNNTEYLTWYLQDDSAFVTNPITAAPEYQRDYRITLDTIDDFRLLEEVFKALYVPGQLLDLKDVLNFLDSNPRIAGMNRSIKPKLQKSELDVSLRI